MSIVGDLGGSCAPVACGSGDGAVAWEESDARMAALDVLARLGIDPPELDCLDTCPELVRSHLGDLGSNGPVATEPGAGYRSPISAHISRCTNTLFDI